MFGCLACFDIENALDLEDSSLSKQKNHKSSEVDGGMKTTGSSFAQVPTTFC